MAKAEEDNRESARRWARHLAAVGSNSGEALLPFAAIPLQRAQISKCQAVFINQIPSIFPAAIPSGPISGRPCKFQRLKHTSLALKARGSQKERKLDTKMIGVIDTFKDRNF
jgi:hypothetical protein